MSQSEVKTLAPCPMCRLGIFMDKQGKPLHGHKLWDGTILLEATIKWA